MRKTLQKKLSLHRETLRSLQESALHGVAGGIVTLPRTVCDNCTDTCRTDCGGSHCTL